MTSVLLVGLARLHGRGVKLVPADEGGVEEVCDAGGGVGVDVGEGARQQAFVVKRFGALLQQGVCHHVNDAGEVRVQEGLVIWNSGWDVEFR